MKDAETRSLWSKSVSAIERAPLERDTEADVCVVGGGIAGMMTAYRLSREGRDVVLLDDGPIGGGMTQRTTAHLVNALDDRFFELERLHGAEGARMAAESHTAAIDEMERIASEEGIDAEFERLDGYLFVPPGEPAEILECERDAARRAGLSVQIVPRAPIEGFDTGPALRFPRQAQIHPLKLLAGLAPRIEGSRGRIFTGVHVTAVKGGKSARIETSGGPAVTAKAVVVATNSPINDWVVLHTKQAPYTTYVIGVRVPRGSVEKALYWDTADPYHYVRLARGGDGWEVLIVGGEDLKTGQEDDFDGRYRRLEAWTRARFAPAGEVVDHWSGQVMEPVDSLAFIGRNPADEENVFVATGDSGNGMTHGAIAGILLTDLVVGRPNPWEKLYRPDRVRLGAALDFARENANVAAQYGSWLTPGEGDLSEIAPGQGAVVRRGLKKVAVYRDPTGRRHEVSAVCVHLGCIVSWNGNEKTWDCPCHGSRFNAYGQVIEGPANADLAPVEEESPAKR